MADGGACAAIDGWRDEAFEAMLRGAELSDVEITELETRLGETPDDLDARFQLVGYYCRHLEHGPLLGGHVVALIERVPEHPATGLPYLSRERDAVVFSSVERAWLKAVEQRKSMAVVLNAHHALARDSFASAERLLLLGLQSCPRDRRWQLAAVRFYRHHGSIHADSRLLAGATAAAERLMALSTTPAQRGTAMPVALLAFVEAGQLRRAEALASEATEMWGFNGHASRYHGHLVLGLVALETGDIEAAEGHLVSSALCVEGFYFEHLGTPLHLARALLDKGRVAAVRRFLSELSSRLTRREEELGQWLQEIERGVKPRLEFTSGR